MIALYTELTSLKMREEESTTDYILRAEKASTALKAAEEVISDGLLVAMALKGLPESYRTFSAIVTQRKKQMTFSEFKMALRIFEETERSCQRTLESSADNVMTAKSKPFQGKCFKCGRKGHKSNECYSKETTKWCLRCKIASHNTKDCRRKQTQQQQTTQDAAKKTADQDTHEFVGFTFSDQTTECSGKT